MTEPGRVWLVEYGLGHPVELGNALSNLLLFYMHKHKFPHMDYAQMVDCVTSDCDREGSA